MQKIGFSGGDEKTLQLYVTPEEAWENLANAVVAQAAEDYREGCRTLRRYPKNKGAFLLKAEAVEFFRSKYFSFFTAVPGEEILRLLEKELVLCQEIEQNKMREITQRRGIR